jgi:hypothetical protein
MPVILVTWEFETRRTTVQSQLGQTDSESCLQNNQSKMAGGVTHAVRHLLCKHKALSSNPSPTKKKKKKKERRKSKKYNEKQKPGTLLNKTKGHFKSQTICVMKYNEHKRGFRTRPRGNAQGHRTQTKPTKHHSLK